MVKFKLFVLLACFFSAGLFCFSFAQTDEELGIPKGVQISPSRIDWDLKSGEERSGTINLKNFSDRSFDVMLEIENFYVSDDSREAKFFVPDEKHPLKMYDVIDWIEIAGGNEIHLDPREGKDIFFKVKVPEGTPTGGYYGVLFFRSAVREDVYQYTDGTESRIGINQRVGMLLVMSVEGKEQIKREGSISKFYPENKIFFQTPAKLLMEVENSGNLPFRSFGKIDIHKFGKKIKTIELIPYVLYPDKIRRYEEIWDFSSWSFGFYRAKALLLSEDEQIKMEKETTFWVIPWKTTLSIIIVLLIVWLILRIFSLKFEIKRKDKTVKEEEDESKEK